MSAVEWLKFILFFFLSLVFLLSFVTLFLSFSQSKRFVWNQGKTFDFQIDLPVQKLYITDIHGVVWNFRHIYRAVAKEDDGSAKKTFTISMAKFFFFRFICFLLARHSLMKFPKESLNDDERFFLGFTYDSRIYWSGIEDVLVS